MDYLDLAYELTGELSAIPWWGWLALLAMIFGGLLAPHFTESPDPRSYEHLRG